MKFEDAVVVKGLGRHHRQGAGLQLAWLLEAIGIHAQDSFCVVAIPPRLQQEIIPVLDSTHVAVNLQQKVLTVVEPLSLAACPASTTTVCCGNILDLQMGVIREGLLAPAQGIRCIQLQANAEFQSLGISGLLEQIVECCGEIRVSISSDLNEDCAGHQRADAMRKVCAIGPTS